MATRKKTQGEIDQDNRIKDNLRGVDWENITFDEFEDLFEDRDLAEFL